MAEENASDRVHEIAPEHPRVLVFFDYACPFCYVDQHRFDALYADLEFETVLMPFELRPALAEEGMDLSEAGSGHSDRVDDHLRRATEKEGYPFVQPGFIPNTHRAIVLGEVARDAGDSIHHEVHRAVFSAYFAKGRDIGSREVLLEIAEETGLGPGELERAWAEGVYDDRLQSFRRVALQLGLDATPAALICSELLIGSRPMGVLRDALQRCGSRPKGERTGLAEDETEA